MKTFKTKVSWSRNKLFFGDRLNGAGELEIEFEDNENFTYDLILDKDQIRELIDHLKSVLADNDATFIEPAKAGEERITFQGQEYIVDRVDIESSFDDYTTWDGFGLARINTNRKMTLTVRPVPPKPKPGDFEAGDTIRRVDSAGPSYTVVRVAGSLWARNGDTMTRIANMFDWVRVE